MLHKYRNTSRKFCSISCGAKHSRAVMHSGNRKTLNCVQCSKEITTNSYAAQTKKYCSRSCADIGKKIPVPHFDCAQCGKNRARRKFGNKSGYDYTTKHCSKQCANDALRKEGWCTDKHGYKCAVFNGKQVFEHRAIMESMIGRKLALEETVHHINGDRADNRPANLELWSSRHGKGQRVSDKVAFAVSLLRQYPEYLEEQGFCLTKLNNNIVNLSDSRKEIGK